MNYNNPFIKMLETSANMVIVSFLWLVFSLPVLTVIPSSAAMFHTTNKIIFGPGKGNGVFKDFFASFKENLRQGILLSLIIIVAVLFIAEGLWTGFQFHKVSLWGMAYFVLGIAIAFVFLTTLVHIAPVLSRFEAPVSSILRMAVYFAIRKPLRSVLFCVLFLVMILSVYAFPLALMIVPALYTDLIRGSLEKDFTAFTEENGLEETEEESEENDEAQEIEADASMADMEERFSKERK
jgi:uncharacterized membrane protein YesL